MTPLWTRRRLLTLSHLWLPRLRSGYSFAMDHRIIISGGSGLIGSALATSLRDDGVRVQKLVRRPAVGEDEIEWDPANVPLPPEVLTGAAAVVNLNGASIGTLPWTQKYRRALWDSRIGPTRTLAESLRLLGSESPKLVSASAVGFYGSEPGKALTEASAPGQTFLARLCVAWERAALSAGAYARVALLRTAPILDKDATLKPLIPLTKLGVSGPLGGGRQVWPWVSLPDEVAAIRHVIDLDLVGPVNLAGPQRATASDIGRELARQLHRPFWLPVPSWALRVAVGADAADSLLLADADVVPDALEQSGFKYLHPDVRSAIAAGL